MSFTIHRKRHPMRTHPICLLTSLLLFSLCFPNTVQADECSEAKQHGKQIAKEQPAGRWYLYGVGSVFLLGGPGILVSTGVGALRKPPLPLEMEVASSSPQEHNCFLTGYHRTMQRRRASRALLGGMVTQIMIQSTIAILGQDSNPSP